MASHGTNGFLKKKLFANQLLITLDCLDCKNIANCIYMIAYSAEGFLKASGWMELMLSPLSQVILARLAFRS